MVNGIEFIDIIEVSSRLKISPNKIRKWERDGDLKAERIVIDNRNHVYFEKKYIESLNLSLIIERRKMLTIDGRKKFTESCLKCETAFDYFKSMRNGGNDPF